MKVFKTAALIIVAAAVTAVLMSGCKLFAFMEQPSDPEAYSTAPTTAKVTEVETTAEQTTAEQTTAEATTKDAQSSGSSASGEEFNTTVVLESDSYYDSYLGITFYMPEWKDKVYVKQMLVDGRYTLSFYEISNHDKGLEKDNYGGMGMLFTLTLADEEPSGDFIDFAAGSIELDGQTKYLVFFKPTDVRYYPDDSLTEAYRSISDYKFDYFKSGVVDADRNYIPSTVQNAVNLTSE